MGTILFIIGILVLLMIAVGVTFWWLMRKDIEKAFNALLAAFMAQALKKGDFFEEQTKKRMLAKLDQVKKFIMSIDIIKTE